MTKRAILAQRSLMNIILRMTGVAIGWRALELIIDMAVCAGCRPVFAGQRKRGQVMVDGCVLPVIGSMAKCAVLAKITLVSVIFGMAGVAICGGTLEDLVDMAGRTINCEVLAYQWEGGGGMVDRCLGPIVRDVAFGAVRSQITLVHVIFGMA